MAERAGLPNWQPSVRFLSPERPLFQFETPFKPALTSKHLIVFLALALALTLAPSVS